MRPAPRLYIPDKMSPGAALPLTVAQTHRLLHVLRLGAGATIAAFNPSDGEYLCRIDELDRRHGRLTVFEQRRAPEPDGDLWLLFAPIKRAPLDWLVEKATELGVAALVPVVTQRTMPERLNRDRLQALAVAASEQSERLSVPEVRAAEPLARLLACWPAGRRLVLCDESGAGQPAAAALAGLDAAAPVAVFIGPEGGFAETELDALGKLSIVTRVGLGPRILRAETAALAALAVYQAVAGDWRLVRER